MRSSAQTALPNSAGSAMLDRNNESVVATNSYIKIRTGLHLNTRLFTGPAWQAPSSMRRRPGSGRLTSQSLGCRRQFEAQNSGMAGNHIYTVPSCARL
jgi:hypothetical protein